jgi:hypothetical protein
VAAELELEARFGLRLHLRDQVTLAPCDDSTAMGATLEPVERHLTGPLEWVARTGNPHANPNHVEMSLDQLLAFRPSPSLSGYRTPIGGLFLTGAGTHPGGGARALRALRAGADRPAGDRRPVGRLGLNGGPGQLRRSGRLCGNSVPGGLA